MQNRLKSKGVDGKGVSELQSQPHQGSNPGSATYKLVTRPA